MLYCYATFLLALLQLVWAASSSAYLGASPALHVQRVDVGCLAHPKIPDEVIDDLLNVELEVRLSHLVVPLCAYFALYSCISLSCCILSDRLLKSLCLLAIACIVGSSSLQWACKV